MTLNGLEIKKILQELIYSIFVLQSSQFSNFYIFYFRIIFERTCYGTTVWHQLRCANQFKYHMRNGLTKIKVTIKDPSNLMAIV